MKRDRFGTEVVDAKVTGISYQITVFSAKGNECKRANERRRKGEEVASDATHVYLLNVHRSRVNGSLYFLLMNVRSPNSFLCIEDIRITIAKIHFCRLNHVLLSISCGQRFMAQILVSVLERLSRLQLWWRRWRCCWRCGVYSIHACLALLSTVVFFCT